MPTIDGVLETALYVEDLDRSVAFYQAIFGFDVITSGARLCALGVADRQTEDIFRRDRVKGVSQDVQRAALRKLLILDATESLDDLRVPPGNRLEKLKGERKSQYRIRVNDQWRICFMRSEGDAYDVEITDYH